MIFCKKKKVYKKPHAEAVVFTLRDSLMWMAQSELGGDQMSPEKNEWNASDWQGDEVDTEENL